MMGHLKLQTLSLALVLLATSSSLPLASTWISSQPAPAFPRAGFTNTQKNDQTYDGTAFAPPSLARGTMLSLPALCRRRPAACRHGLHMLSDGGKTELERVREELASVLQRRKQKYSGSGTEVREDASSKQQPHQQQQQSSSSKQQAPQPKSVQQSQQQQRSSEKWRTPLPFVSPSGKSSSEKWRDPLPFVSPSSKSVDPSTGAPKASNENSASRQNSQTQSADASQQGHTINAEEENTERRAPQQRRRRVVPQVEEVKWAEPTFELEARNPRNPPPRLPLRNLFSRKLRNHLASALC